MAPLDYAQDGELLLLPNVYKTDRDIIHVIEKITHIPVTVKAIVNEKNRQQKAVHHTATHLLHAAVRNILGETVSKQAL